MLLLPVSVVKRSLVDVGRVPVTTTLMAQLLTKVEYCRDLGVTVIPAVCQCRVTLAKLQLKHISVQTV